MGAVQNPMSNKSITAAKMKFVCLLPVVVCVPQSPPSKTHQRNARACLKGNFQLPKLKINEKGSKTLTLKRASLIEAKHIKNLCSWSTLFIYLFIYLFNKTAKTNSKPFFIVEKLNGK